MRGDDKLRVLFYEMMNGRDRSHLVVMAKERLPVRPLYKAAARELIQKRRHK